MSKILLIGYNPPQLEQNTKIEAAHYRTWQFLDPLVRDGHRICLCANNLTPDSDASPDVPEAWSRHVEYHAIPFQRQRGWIKQLQQIHDSFAPDCVVAVNFDCCLAATKLKTDRPVWMDIYGDYLTIMQVARYRVGSDRGIQTSIEFMRRVLQRGDSFSVCGTPQAHMMVGELAMAGRLNSRTFGYEFTNVVLPGSPPVETLHGSQAGRKRLSEKNVPQDAFVVLWCGGYNTWTDVDTLFKGLEWAMNHHSNVHYVSVGANTYEAPDNVYTRLQAMIAQSPHRERFHMLGWRPWVEVADYYRESDIGFNIDALHYETLFGTRTRLVEMLGTGLPVVTSLGCELSDLIGQYGAGLTFESGDWQGMGEQILNLAKDKTLFTNAAQKAIDYATNELSFANTTASVRNWVNAPTMAPDNAPENTPKLSHRVEYKARAMLRQLIWQVSGMNR
jgi:glycosyltransferase involved in cell wall biosynthesis